MSESKIFVPVPKDCMGLIIGSKGRHINELKEKTQTTIEAYSPEHCFTKTRFQTYNPRNESGFIITGSKANCDAARLEIQQKVEEWKNAKRYTRRVPVPRKFVGLINGKHGRTLAKLKTLSRANIWLLDSESDDEMGIFLVSASSKENFDKAVTLIKEKVSDNILHHEREELGGDVHFACFNYASTEDEFLLVQTTISKSRYGRAKYRIQSDIEDNQNDIFSAETKSSIYSYLCKSLEKLHELKDERRLRVDLWFHFCKVLVEIEEADAKEHSLTVKRINKRLLSVVNGPNKDAYWRTMVGDFIDPTDVKVDALFHPNDSEDELLKHVETFWRYDCGFFTEGGLVLRLKVWQGLPIERNEPPDEVKNVLQQVFFKGKVDGDVKAWLCSPSITVIKGDIMTPYSKYDCRMKLRAGPRNFADRRRISKDVVDNLADYLSHCTIDKVNHKLILPDEANYPIPADFHPQFYREAEERIFTAVMDGERYTVAVFDEAEWDATLTEKRSEKEFGIRVMMDSWSKELLSPERNWEPAKILSKLNNYMDFLSVLYRHLFD